MGSLTIVLTALAIYHSEVYCDTLSIRVAKPEGTALPGKGSGSHAAAIEQGSFWKDLSSVAKRKPQLEESRSLGEQRSTNNEVDRRKGRFLNNFALLTGFDLGGLATAASSTVKGIAKVPQVFGLNLGSTKTSPFFAAYYSQYPYAPLLPNPLFYPGALGLAPIAKPQTSQSDDLTPQVISLFDNRPNDLAGSDEDYAGNGADDDRVRLRADADRNAEEKNAIRGCKESQRKHGKGTSREREYVDTADLRATFNLRDANETGDNNATTVKPDNTTQHHHYHHHHHHHKEYPYSPGYYGGYPQSIHHVELTTTPPIGYNVPYEPPANFYQDGKYVYPGLNPPFSAPFSPDQTNEFVGADFNFKGLYPSYQPPNISDGFKPFK